MSILSLLLYLNQYYFVCLLFPLTVQSKLSNLVSLQSKLKITLKNWVFNVPKTIYITKI